jgi:hypothetical protein
MSDSHYLSFHLLCLADAMASLRRLVLHGGVPPWVAKDDPRGHLKVKPFTSGLEVHQKHLEYTSMI